MVRFSSALFLVLLLASAAFAAAPASQSAQSAPPSAPGEARPSPEGTAVAPGDVLVRFDTGAFQLALGEQRAALAQAEADLVRAREELRLEELRVQADAEGADQDLRLAEETLRNDLDGRGRVQIAEAEAAVAETAREVARATRAYDDTRPLLDEGFVTRAELERIEQALRRAEEQHRLARLLHESITRYERPAALAKAHERSSGAIRSRLVKLGLLQES